MATQPTIVPEALKSARAERKVSQAKLAADAGVSIGYVGMIELGQRQPRRDVIRALADALDVPMKRISVNVEPVARTRTIRRAS